MKIQELQGLQNILGALLILSCCTPCKPEIGLIRTIDPSIAYTKPEQYHGNPHFVQDEEMYLQEIDIANMRAQIRFRNGHTAWHTFEELIPYTPVYKHVLVTPEVGVLIYIEGLQAAKRIKQLTDLGFIIDDNEECRFMQKDSLVYMHEENTLIGRSYAATGRRVWLIC